jgi:integrase
MASVFKTKDRDGKPHKIWRFKYKDHTGKWAYGTGWPDKQKTVEHALTVEAEHRAVKRGEKVDPNTWLRKRNKPISEILSEYLAWGNSCGGRNGRAWDKQNAAAKSRYLTWWIAELSLRVLADIEVLNVEKAMQDLQANGLKPKSVYLRFEALRSLCLWAVKRDLLPLNPLRSMAHMDVRPSEPHRALTEEEVADLMNAAPHDRRVWYETALQTGYRVGELRELRVRDLDMNGPSLPLGCDFTKNRKDARQPITASLAEKLKRLTIGRAPESKLLSIPSSYGYKRIAADYVAGGVALKTEAGKATWHSLRKVFVNNLVRSGADVKTIMELARHSSAEMSLDVYASAKPQLLRTAIEKAVQHMEATINKKDPLPCCAGVKQEVQENNLASASSSAEAKLHDFEVVRATGVEPALPCGNQPLKLARLPIPPRAHYANSGSRAAVLARAFEVRATIAETTFACQMLRFADITLLLLYIDVAAKMTFSHRVPRVEGQPLKIGATTPYRVDLPCEVRLAIGFACGSVAAQSSCRPQGNFSARH